MYYATKRSDNKKRVIGLVAVVVINALLFWLVGSILDGFRVQGFGGALIGSILFSLVSWLLSAIVLRDRGR